VNLLAKSWGIPNAYVRDEISGNWHRATTQVTQADPRAQARDAPNGCNTCDHAVGFPICARHAPSLGRITAELAYGEGLQAHARAAELRLNPVPPRRT
jgi:hypothetical protein